MPPAVIKIAVEIPNPALAPEIQRRFSVLIRDDDPIWRNLILRMLLDFEEVVPVQGDHVLADLKDGLTVRVCKIGIQIRSALLEGDPDKARHGGRAERADHEVSSIIDTHDCEILRCRECVTAESNSWHEATLLLRTLRSHRTLGYAGGCRAITTRQR